MIKFNNNDIFELDKIFLERIKRTLFVHVY